MTNDERRRHHRASLRFPIRDIQGASQFAACGGLWTSNVSAGGMFFQVTVPSPPREGQDLSFELVVPPGEGYSAAGGRIRGTGTVVRSCASQSGAAGIAVQFGRPLRLDF